MRSLRAKTLPGFSLPSPVGGVRRTGCWWRLTSSDDHHPIRRPGSMKPTALALSSFATLPLVLGAYVRSTTLESAPPIVTVTAHDYALQMPDTLPAGATTL